MTEETEKLVCGIDAGATSSKGALIRVKAGEVALLSAARSGSGNAWAVGEERAVANVSELIDSLCSQAGVAASEIAAIAIGVAGKLSTGAAALAATCPQAASVVTNDAVPMFSSGSDSETGVVIVAGTGSIAFRIDGDYLSSRGGWGWLLGDEGSGVSLGRRVLRAALSSLEGGAETALTGLVAAQLGIGDEGILQAAIFEHVYDGEGFSTRVSKFAPLASEAALAGDAVAEEMLDAVADEVMSWAEAASLPGDPVVIGGSVALSLEQRLHGRAKEIELTLVQDGVVGALRLAAAKLGQSVSVESLRDKWEIASATL